MSLPHLFCIHLRGHGENRNNRKSRSKALSLSRGCEGVHRMAILSCFLEAERLTEGLHLNIVVFVDVVP